MVEVLHCVDQRGVGLVRRSMVRVLPRSVARSTGEAQESQVLLWYGMVQNRMGMVSLGRVEVMLSTVACWHSYAEQGGGKARCRAVKLGQGNAQLCAVKVMSGDTRLCFVKV